jgi:hypothetical protein
MMISILKSNDDIHVVNCRTQGSSELVFKMPNIPELKAEGFSVLNDYSMPVYNTLSAAYEPIRWTFVDGNPYRHVLRERSLGGGIVVTVYDAQEL